MKGLIVLCLLVMVAGSLAFTGETQPQTNSSGPSPLRSFLVEKGYVTETSTFSVNSCHLGAECPAGCVIEYVSRQAIDVCELNGNLYQCAPGKQMISGTLYCVASHSPWPCANVPYTTCE